MDLKKKDAKNVYRDYSVIHFQLFLKYKSILIQLKQKKKKDGALEIFNIIHFIQIFC